MHNEFIMINNLLKLKNKTQTEKVLFDQTIVILMKFTAEIVQLNCH